MPAYAGAVGAAGVLAVRHVVAGTGHRPNKLGGYGPEPARRLRELARIYLQLLAPSEVITGMALGWDTALGWAAVDLGLTLHAAVPFEGQESQWPAESQRQFRALLARCSSVTVVSRGSYDPRLMQVRNEWMVDRADSIAALYDGTPGGTRNCVRYAESCRKPVVNLWAAWTARD